MRIRGKLSFMVGLIFGGKRRTGDKLCGGSYNNEGYFSGTYGLGHHHDIRKSRLPLSRVLIIVTESSDLFPESGELH